MRPKFNLVVLLSFIFVLHTGYYPTDTDFNGYQIIKANGKELNKLIEDDAIAIAYKDVSYGPGSKQNFDIYLPADRSASRTKVLLVIHGGSWVRGDKENLNSFVTKLMDLFPDHAIVNMNYTLGSETQQAFPKQFTDIELIIEHLTLLNAEYKISPQFGIVGRSAGGHLGLVFDSKYDKLDQVKFVCSIAGPTNLTDPLFKRNPDFDMLHTILIDHNVYREEPIKEISPLHNASFFTSPSLLLYGQDDKKVPISNGLDFSRTLDETGVTNELVIFKGGHVRNWTNAEWDKAFDSLENFVDTYLN